MGQTGQGDRRETCYAGALPTRTMGDETVAGLTKSVVSHEESANFAACTCKG
jgi:hypothetical protein